MDIMVIRVECFLLATRQYNQKGCVRLRQSMIEGIKAVRPGATTGDIGAAIQECHGQQILCCDTVGMV